MNRRQLIGATGTAATFMALASRAHARPFVPALGPRCRVLIVNDLAGDIDALFATVHALLSPSTEIRTIVGTQAGFSGETASQAAAIGNEIIKIMHLAKQVTVHSGATAKLASTDTPDRSPGVQAIIDEAMRTDTSLPLYITVGGGLTEVASALLIEPAIAEKFTLVWIGGGAYPDGGKGDTNFNIDPVAAQFVFNKSKVPLWQVPSDAYAQCQVSASELQAFVAPRGAIGKWLHQKLIESSATLGRKYRINTGETWTLGDSPLVLLTALTHWGPSGRSRPFRYERMSSLFDERLAPLLKSDGSYEARTDGRRIRVYKTLDTRLLFGDFFTKMRLQSTR
jgi:hypothetical protein